MMMILMTIFSSLINFNLLSKKFNLIIIYMLLFFFLHLKFSFYWGLKSSFSMSLSLDVYSFYLILLSLWIVSCMLLLTKNFKIINLMIVLMLLMLIMIFSLNNFMLFYLMFESSLLPIMIMILYGGYSYERFEAFVYMMMFTILSSMPFLWLLFLLMNNYHSLNMSYLELLNVQLGWLGLMMFLLTFLVKMPVFMVHIWLPKAHVEAPVYGSMILAGVLLKLGSYGCLRICQIMFIDINNFNSYYICLGMVGGVFMSLLCLIQVDMKMLVAYSSIVHMSMLMSSMMTLNKLGIIGSYMMMLAHGLCSSGLFFLVNLNYERSNSRLMYLNKGLLNIYKSLSMWWFLYCIYNMSAPVSLNLISEFIMFMSLLSWDMMMFKYLMMMSFCSAAYSLYLFSFMQHGNLNLLNNKFLSIKIQDYCILLFHWIPLNFMYLFIEI